MEFIEDDRIPITKIVEMITPKDLVKPEDKRTGLFSPRSFTTKASEIGSRCSRRRKRGICHQNHEIYKKMVKKLFFNCFLAETY
jgi:hypothetical protein